MGEFAAELKICTRWRRIGERIGRRAGGGRGDTKAVGRQASKGGSRVRGSGDWMRATISFISMMMMLLFSHCFS